jgi:hypothetical protein
VKDEFDFAAHEARMKMLRERLAAAPIVDLVGVVGASPPGGSQSRGETLWTMRFDLEAWRIGAGEMQTRRMTIRRPVKKEELHTWQERIEPFSVLRLRARVVDDPAFVQAEALLGELIGQDALDEQLKQCADQLQVPLAHEDPVLGTLILDRSIDTYRGHAVWNGSRVEVDVGADEGGNIEDGLSTLRELWRDQQGWDKRISDYAVQQLLEVKNNTGLIRRRFL